MGITRTSCWKAFSILIIDISSLFVSVHLCIFYSVCWLDFLLNSLFFIFYFKQVISYLNDIFGSLLSALSDPSDEVTFYFFLNEIFLLVILFGYSLCMLCMTQDIFWNMSTYGQNQTDCYHTLIKHTAEIYQKKTKWKNWNYFRRWKQSQ